MSIFLTGCSGFVGTNLISAFRNDYNINCFDKNKELVINEKIVIHLAGKAHDLKNISKPEEYYQVNTELTKRVFDSFLASNASVFIALSSVKAVADQVEGELFENVLPRPITHYGKSKLLAEQYILNSNVPSNKRIYILRPCMIHGPGNKGNLNLLYNLVSKGIPWPLGIYDNLRSFCSIENLLFVINELIERDDIPSGVYNIADDEPLSTNTIISLIALSLKKTPKIWKISKKLIILLSKLGDRFNLPLNTERLEKLTQNYIVSNQKLVEALGVELPIKAKQGMLNTLRSFN